MPVFLLFLATLTLAQTPPPAAPPDAPKPETAAPAKPEAAAAPQTQRTTMNLLGQTDSGSGESRRNENVQFNLIDTATMKELMVRLGATATIQSEFAADRTYFGGEFGARPPASLHLPGATGRAWHGLAAFSHLNSAASARSFFQASSVRPARENEPALSVSGPAWRGAWVAVDLSLQRLRGNVNGNVLVPLLSERTALATDPALRRIAQSTARAGVFRLR
ncbi:MAG: hypothetical protein IT162_19320, partial [Bryobacterales bacterium]|nr:hypothetical protein [Bryobacterales bacterium]